MLKSRKGFTLIELIFVLVMIAVLTIVSIPIYRGYMRQAVVTEGKALLDEVSALQEVYFSRFAGYSDSVDGVDLNIDMRGNKYFRHFDVDITADGLAYTATTRNEKNTIEITMEASRYAPAEIIVGFVEPA
jgi:type IV pilus assembly protein PilE